MASSYVITRKLLVTALAAIISIVFLGFLWDIASTSNLGGGDFWGYWSATFLLRNGQNPYNPDAMRIIQTTQMHTGLNFTIMSWNPPTLFVIILPLTLLSITHAKFIWLIVNLTLIIATIRILINLYQSRDNASSKLSFLFFAFIMPQILSGIYVGQVTILVTFGLAASMMLIKKGHWFWAGAVLILTTIKPHLVVLQVIYLLLYVTQERKVQVWAGLTLAGLVFIVALFTLRPQLISDLAGLSKIAPTKWFTPTIGGWLSYLSITEITRYLIVLFMPIPFILAKYRTNLDMEFSIALLTLITVPFTFFGWSYDQVILLIPIAQVFHWLYQSKVRVLKYALSLLMIAAIGINYYQKIIGIYEVYYVWVPLFWCLAFGTAWHYLPRSTYTHEQTTL